METFNELSERLAVDPALDQSNVPLWDPEVNRLLAAVLHPQFRNHAAPPRWRDGLQGAVAVVHQLNDAFSGLRYVTLQTLVDGDRVAVHNTCTGRHTGPWAGLPPSGRSFSAEQVHILRFDADGLATEHWAVRDDLTLLRQLEGPDVRRAPVTARGPGSAGRTSPTMPAAGPFTGH